MSDRVAVRDAPWEDLPDGRVRITRRKFGRVGSRILRVFGISPDLNVTLDAIGATAWRAMDGRTVAHVLEALRETYPDEPGLDERLGRFLAMLVRNRLARIT